MKNINIYDNIHHMNVHILCRIHNNCSFLMKMDHTDISGQSRIFSFHHFCVVIVDENDHVDHSDYSDNFDYFDDFDCFDDEKKMNRKENEKMTIESFLEKDDEESEIQAFHLVLL